MTGRFRPDVELVLFNRPAGQLIAKDDQRLRRFDHELDVPAFLGDFNHDFRAKLEANIAGFPPRPVSGDDLDVDVVSYCQALAGSPS
jgi:hypothetical protein